MDVFATYLQNALSELDGIKVEMVATTKQDRIYNKQKNGDFDLASNTLGTGLWRSYNLFNNCIINKW